MLKSPKSNGNDLLFGKPYKQGGGRIADNRINLNGRVDTKS